MPEGALLWGLVGLVVLTVSGAAGYYLINAAIKRKKQSAEAEIKSQRNEAETESKDLILKATKESLQLRNSAEIEVRERRQDIQRLERRVNQKEENLDRKLDQADQKERQITTKEKEVESAKAEILNNLDRQLAELQRVANMTQIEAKDALLQAVEHEVREDANRRLMLLEKAYKEEADRRARDIVMQAIQGVTSEVVSDSTTSMVTIPNEEMKGRIIGREGRNIRALEHATGVDIIIDDTPDCVTLSSFDPIRREIARLALTRLVSDGRIHPSRIEDVVELAKSEIDQTMLREGERASYESNVPDLHPDLIRLMGRLKYRYSYGQNVLEHSIETTKFAAIVAAELGANVGIVKKGSILHDIGKGLDHEIEGPHALIGAGLVERYEKSREVIICIAKHHDDWFTNTLEGAVVQVADAISGGRPGARAESMDRYIKRLQALEEIALSFDGVEKTYAVQAGREIRIIVRPDKVDDLSATRLAREVARRVEESLEYPGQIKVTVVRETRAIEYAQ
jgi:ribonuclease Y